MRENIYTFSEIRINIIRINIHLYNFFFISLSSSFLSLLNLELNFIFKNELTEISPEEHDPLTHSRPSNPYLSRNWLLFKSNSLFPNIGVGMKSQNTNFENVLL